MALLGCILLALMADWCRGQSRVFGPDIQPADLNFHSLHDMSSSHYCNQILPHRNGMIYSHEEALVGDEFGYEMDDSRRCYQYDIDCTLTILVGKGWLTGKRL